MRITTTKDDAGSITLKVEGRVTGAWAEELGRVFNETRQSVTGKFVVDLTSVTFIDDVGKQVLKQICGCGGEFIATGCHNRGVIDEIRNCSA
jgi:anti-anti-sigma regulatory factor